MRQHQMPAVICDLDGTLANLNGRLPYGEAQKDCEQDLCRTEVKDVLEALNGSVWVILVSGRLEQYREQTLRWLHGHYIYFDELHMRPNDQASVSDTIIKSDIYENEIKPYYKVLFVIDDRPKVIRMWRKKGLLVLDVGNGEEF